MRWAATHRRSGMRWNKVPYVAHSFALPVSDGFGSGRSKLAGATSSIAVHSAMGRIGTSCPRASGPRTSVANRAEVRAGAGVLVARGGITDGLGVEWESRNASFKPFPTAHVLHPYVSALLRLREAHRLTAADVAAIAERRIALLDPALAARAARHGVTLLPELAAGARIASSSQSPSVRAVSTRPSPVGIRPWA